MSRAVNGLAADEVRYSLRYLVGGTAMPVTVKSISLWRKEAENKTGLLAQTLEPLTKAGADLGVVMGYRLPGNEAKAAIEIYPVSGKKVKAAATETGLAASAIRPPPSKGIISQVWRTKSHRRLRTLEPT